MQIEATSYMWLASYYGEAKTDKLMRDVGIEAIKHTPATAFVFLDNFFRAAVMRDSAIDYSAATFSSFSNFFDHATAALWRYKDMRTSILPPALAQHLSIVDDYNNWKNIVLTSQYFIFWRLTKFIFFAGMLFLALPLMLLRETAAPVLLLFTLHVYNATAISVIASVFDLPRYEDAFIFLAVMITVLGLSNLPRFARWRASLAAGPAEAGRGPVA